ncbi:MAG TPA: hypothetical protein VK846_13630 [Candidatus Limnocylindria bacterium]|nr:hypothetical protein [Candidatus Limnocylindria bacterium]
MKTVPLATSSSRRRRRGTTLVELLITMITTVVVIGGAMATYIYGLKMMQFTQPKLTASDEARKAVFLLTEDVRAAYNAEVGNRVNNKFVPFAANNARKGNALRIFPTSNTNQYVIYFCDTNAAALTRTTNNTQFTVVVNYVTNKIAFTAEDFKGTILMNDTANFVIGMTLQVYQLSYPTVSVGAGQYYDWYQLRTKVTRRNIL